MSFRYLLPHYFECNSIFLFFLGVNTLARNVLLVELNQIVSFHLFGVCTTRSLFHFGKHRAKFFPPLLLKLYMLGWGLGAAYSVPPFRTRQNPILAGLTIATVRGFLLNFGVYFAVKDAIGSSFSWSPKVSFIARFMTGFATVIAVTKDLPDIEGDKVNIYAS